MSLITSHIWLLLWILKKIKNKKNTCFFVWCSLFFYHNVRKRRFSSQQKSDLFVFEVKSLEKCCCLRASSNDATCSSHHCFKKKKKRKKRHVLCIFCWVWYNFDLTLRNCRLKKNWEKGCKNKKGRCYVFMSQRRPSGEFYLTSWFPLAIFSSLFFVPWITTLPFLLHLLPITFCSNIPSFYLLLPVFLFATHLSPSFYHLSSCHFAEHSWFQTTHCNPVYLYKSFCSTSPPFFLFHLLFAANVCDEEMLLCQNGGTCFQNQKCMCPPEFKGVLCQQSRCEAGKDCNGASSPHICTVTLLLCSLLTHMLATLAPHWATITAVLTMECAHEYEATIGPKVVKANQDMDLSKRTQQHSYKHPQKTLPSPILFCKHAPRRTVIYHWACAQVWERQAGATSEKKRCSQRGRKKKKKSCQPLFPLFLSRSNLHQTKKYKHSNSLLSHFKGNGCCNHEDVFFPFSCLGWGCHLCQTDGPRVLVRLSVRTRQDELTDGLGGACLILLLKPTSY